MPAGVLQHCVMSYELIEVRLQKLLQQNLVTMKGVVGLLHVFAPLTGNPLSRHQRNHKRGQTAPGQFRRSRK